MYYESSARKSCILFNFYLVTSTITIFYFLYGFFPINYNEDVESPGMGQIPKTIGNITINTDELYKKEVDKVILIVIDALRWNFVNGPESTVNMPETKRFLQSGNGCLYKTKVHPPTVTLPRVKAIATGTVPNFVDVILNLGASELRGDSFLRQAWWLGHKIVFYGDLTWTQLFPNLFYRHEKTDTFMVTEYKEPDKNVTRNLLKEFERHDWTMMILHYSGLDHIGHMQGPHSPLIKEKLLEMDEVIKITQNYVKKTNEKGQSTLFLITGDHGMRESGSHGGSTPDETLVPLLALGRPCTLQNINELVSQIDIAPTITALMAVPIPHMSVGAVIPNMMINLTVSQQLYILYYNAKELFRHFLSDNSYETSDAYQKYKKAVRLHVQWLERPNNSSNKIISLYRSSILEMQTHLTSNLFRYNNFIISGAIVTMITIIFLNIFSERAKKPPSNVQDCLLAKFIIIQFIIFSSWLLVWSCIDQDPEENLLSQFNEPYAVLSAVFFITVLLVNSCLFCFLKFSPPKKQILLLWQEKNFSSLHLYLPLALLIQTVLMASTSFVEEEHQIWYFFGSAMLARMTYEALRKYGEKDLSLLKFPLEFVAGMVIHRMFVYWNSTGYQNGSAYDIVDWIYDTDSKTPISCLLCLSLLLLVAVDVTYEEKQARPYLIFFDAFMAFLIYIRHSIDDEIVIRPAYLPESREIVEVQLYWLGTLIFTIISLYRLTVATWRKEDRLLRLFLEFTLKLWIMSSALLQRPHNVILLSLQVACGVMIARYTDKMEKRGLKIYLYILSSNVFFFYQGNSNSLSTVDLKAGYVGLESYWPVITGAYLIINTYSAHVVGFLMFLLDQAYLNPLLSPRIIILLCQQYVFWRLIPLTFFMIVMTLHRYHLSIWTVFSPKLLYEASHTLTLFVVIIIIELCFYLHRLSFGKD